MRPLRPFFGRFFGEAYGPADALVMRDCFVAKYEAGGQSGLAGHVDASLLSLVMTLSAEAADSRGGVELIRVVREEIWIWGVR